MHRFLICLAAFALVVLLCAAFSTHECDILKWGYSGVWRAHENVSGDGAKNYQSRMNGCRSAIELRPTLGTPAVAPEATTEVVIYGNDTMNGPWSRMNWSAIPNGGGHYRFGVEGPELKNVLFAFEGDVGQPAQIPLQLGPDGAGVIEGSPRLRAVLDCNPIPNRGTGLWLVMHDEQGVPLLQRVEQGPPDSGGAGFRTLRVAN
jgi:hypothetical protein